MIDIHRPQLGVMGMVEIDHLDKGMAKRVAFCIIRTKPDNV